MPQCALRAEYRLRERVTGKEHVLKVVVDKFAGRIVVTLNLVVDHHPLLVCLGFRERGTEHHLGDQTKRLRHMFVESSGVERCFLLGGISIDLAAHSLDL